MCGISFYYSQEKTQTQQLENSLRITSHRGPDSSRIYEAFDSNTYCGLGHNRLSIIDLSDNGVQPMSDINGITIAFNGEVYNFKSLRTELELIGESFVSMSDTEVILKMYGVYGVESFKRLKGMFSFVIFDPVEGCSYVVRDHVGVKPMYFFISDGEIYGCSELKGLRMFESVKWSVCEDDIYEFFNVGFISEPKTGYEGVNKVLPGHYLKINHSTLQTESIKYSDLSNDVTSDNFDEHLSQVVKNQQTSDVPLGIFFSGGADSSVLAGLAKSSSLLFAKYSKNQSSDYDLKYSKLISSHLGSKLTVCNMEESKVTKDLIQQISFVAKNTEEPISDYTFWSTYQLSKAARESGYTVMLSGMGGDEIFAGYPRYRILGFHGFLNLCSPITSLLIKYGLYPSSLSKKIERLLSFSEESNFGIAYQKLLGYFSTNELKNLFPGNYVDLDCRFRNRVTQQVSDIKSCYNVSNNIKLAQFLDSHGFLSHNLMVADKASMLASIEMRVPLLDEGLFDYGLRSKVRSIYDIKGGKKPLRKLLSKILPKKLIDRPKTGFNPPIDKLIENLGKETVANELSVLGGNFNKEFIAELVNEHFKGKVNNSYKIWQLLYFKYWVSYCFDDEYRSKFL